MGDMISNEDRKTQIGQAITAQRELAEKTVVKSAALLGIPPDEYLQFERGEKSPSLPQLEALAYFFKVPFGSLLEFQAVTGIPRVDLASITSLISLREKIISSLLKKSRLDKGFSVEDLAYQAQLTVDDINAYEIDQNPIPQPILENLCAVLDVKLESLFSSITAQPEEATQIPIHADPNLLGEMPVHLVAFFSDPNNIPYLELAMKLSQLDAAKIREIAESLLEITY
jgi:transcriptional regulator with XRE-family HTH domain